MTTSQALPRQAFGRDIRPGAAILAAILAAVTAIVNPE